MFLFLAESVPNTEFSCCLNTSSSLLIRRHLSLPHPLVSHSPLLGLLEEELVGWLVGCLLAWLLGCLVACLLGWLASDCVK
jgi:hypothetical protein